MIHLNKRISVKLILSRLSQSPTSLFHSRCQPCRESSVVMILKPHENFKIWSITLNG